MRVKKDGKEVGRVKRRYRGKDGKVGQCDIKRDNNLLVFFIDMGELPRMKFMFIIGHHMQKFGHTPL